MQPFSLDSRDADNAKLLDELGISQLGNNSIPELNNSDQLFHESLVQSIQELLASEAALEAEAAAASASRLNAGSMAGASHVQAAPAFRLDGLPLSAESLASQQQQLPSGGGASLTSGLPLETLELLAASHLQLLVQQQAMMAQQPSRNTLQHGNNLSSMLLNAQPAGHTNDGSLMFVTPQHSSLVGMQPGWVGHRVVALPGDHPHKQLTHMDLSTLSASSQQSAFSHPHLSVRSEDIIRHNQMGSRTNMPPAASWDHLSASSVPSLQTLLQPPSSSRTSTASNSNPHELPSMDLRDFPTIARRGRGRPYGPKSLRQRMPAALPDFGGIRPGAPLRSAAPSWAGADWDPLRDAQNRPKTAGTGVFLPPGTGVFLPVSEEAGSSKADSPRFADSLSGEAMAGGSYGGARASAVRPAEAHSFDDLPASLLP